MIFCKCRIHFVISIQGADLEVLVGTTLLNVYIVAMVLLRDNVMFVCALLASELIYSIEQHDYNLVNSSDLHFMLDVYRVYYMLNTHS